MIQQQFLFYVVDQSHPSSGEEENRSLFYSIGGDDFARKIEKFGKMVGANFLRAISKC